MIDHDQALRQIIARAQEDAGFRARLKADPRATVASFLSIEIPSAVAVTVVEDSPTHLHIVLPAAGDQLSDADLEAVASYVTSLVAKAGPNDTTPANEYQDTASDHFGQPFEGDEWDAWFNEVVADHHTQNDQRFCRGTSP